MESNLIYIWMVFQGLSIIAISGTLLLFGRVLKKDQKANELSFQFLREEQQRLEEKCDRYISSNTASRNNPFQLINESMLNADLKSPKRQKRKYTKRKK